MDLSKLFNSEQWLTAAGNSTDEPGGIKTKQSRELESKTLLRVLVLCGSDRLEIPLKLHTVIELIVDIKYGVEQL